MRRITRSQRDEAAVFPLSYGSLPSQRVHQPRASIQRQVEQPGGLLNGERQPRSVLQLGAQPLKQCLAGSAIPPIVVSHSEVDSNVAANSAD